MSVIHTLLTAVALRLIDTSCLVFTNLTLRCISKVRSYVIWQEQDNQLKRGCKVRNAYVKGMWQLDLTYTAKEVTLER